MANIWDISPIVGDNYSWFYWNDDDITNGMIIIGLYGDINHPKMMTRLRWFPIRFCNEIVKVRMMMPSQMTQYSCQVGWNHQTGPTNTRLA